MSDTAFLQHAGRVRDVVNATLARGECSNVVMRSWTRCVQDYALDPTIGSAGIETPRRDFTQRLERNDLLISNAKGEMSGLLRQLARDDAVVVLADASGIVLDTMGDAACLGNFARAGMRPGFDWSERASGTNGVGTCLAEQRPVTVDRSEHFFPGLTGLSCIGAPIFGDDGKLVGVLDVSAESDLGQQHFRMLIGMSAQTIENRLFEARNGEFNIMHLHSRRELVHTFHEGLLAIDDAGCIVAANQGALFQLGIARRSGLIGRNVRELFQLSMGELIFRGDALGGQIMPIKSVCGRAFFAAMRVPGRSPARSTVAGSQPATRAKDGAGATNPAGQQVWGDARIEADLTRAMRVYERGVYVMLSGETGCGKEVFAKAMHDAGSRAKGPFVAVNCAAVPETLIESELFGYRGGAFTGASREGRRGRILAADKGTLLLDEIGDMPLQLQARLLRVLEEQEVTPLGGESSVKVDIRVICATHRDLREMVAAGTFRGDLYFRLAAFTVELSPLRKRANRAELVRAILGRLGPDLDIEPAAMALLEAFPWPGNLRQLRNVLQTTSALCDSQLIRCEDLPPEIRFYQSEQTPPTQAQPASVESAPSLANIMADEPDGLSCLDRAEREALAQLLMQNHWNVTRVAAHLGVSRNTVYRKVNQYGLVRD